MSVVRYFVKGLAYEWKDLYGIDGAPPAPVRIIPVVNKTFGLIVPSTPTERGFPRGRAKKPEKSKI